MSIHMVQAFGKITIRWIQMLYYEILISVTGHGLGIAIHKRMDLGGGGS